MGKEEGTGAEAGRGGDRKGLCGEGTVAQSGWVELRSDLEQQNEERQGEYRFYIICK